MNYICRAKSKTDAAFAAEMLRVKLGCEIREVQNKAFLVYTDLPIKEISLVVGPDVVVAEMVDYLLQEGPLQ